MDEYKEKRKEFDKDFPNVLATINGGSSLDIIQLDVENSKIEELLEEATNTVERMLHDEKITCECLSWSGSVSCLFLSRMPQQSSQFLKIECICGKKFTLNPFANNTF